MIEERAMAQRNGAAAAVGQVEDFLRNAVSTENPVISEAIRRMLHAGGKRLRPQICLLASQACGAQGSETIALAAYIELIHVATLIHDDVVDRAATRRGVNATAVDFGNRTSVLAGDYLFAWIFKNVTATYAPPIPHILSATLAEICDGEVLQLRSLGNLALTPEEYLAIASRKTASLFASGAECGALAARGSGEARAALRDFGRYYGVAFQMHDDLLDFTASAERIGKPAGNDLRERKVTIPLILALRSGSPELAARAAAFFAENSREDVPGLLAEVARNGGFERTRQEIARYCGLAKISLEPLENVPVCEQLRKLADALTEEEA